MFIDLRHISRDTNRLPSVVINSWVTRCQQMRNKGNVQTDLGLYFRDLPTTEFPDLDNLPKFIVVTYSTVNSHSILQGRHPFGITKKSGERRLCIGRTSPGNLGTLLPQVKVTESVKCGVLRTHVEKLPAYAYIYIEWQPLLRLLKPMERH